MIFIACVRLLHRVPSEVKGNLTELAHLLALYQAEVEELNAAHR